MMGSIFAIIGQADTVFLASHFVFTAVAALVLLNKRLTEKQFSILLGATSATYHYMFYGKFLHIFSLVGDNLCQIAYWNILSRPNLIGSIGASFTKPGQILILGPLFELQKIFGENVFQLGLCLIMASCVWILARIAAVIGGRKAGLAALLFSTWVFRFDFFVGSFSIFLIPTLFIGLWLYFYHEKYLALGRLFLAFSIQFHIMAIAVMGVVWLIRLLRKEWRELAFFSGCCALSLGIWALILIRVQGTFKRFSLGASAGYLPSENYLLYKSKIDFLIKSMGAELSGNQIILLLLAITAIGIAGAIYYGHRYYLSVFSIAAFLLINVALFGGGINLGRYFCAMYAFGCSVGIGSLALLLNRLTPKTSGSRWLGIITTVLVLMAFSLSSTRSAALLGNATTQPMVRSATCLLDDPNLDGAQSLMTEDDLLYPLVVIAPDRFRKLTALQLFNVADEEQRKNILAQTGHIWIVRTGEHMYYYLNHLADAAWNHDPFRLMVAEIQKTGRSQTLYGYRFILSASNYERMLLRVERAG